MHGHTEAPREGVSRDAGHCHVDRAGAAPAGAAAGSAAVTADGTGVAAEPRPRGLDAGQVG